MAKIKWDPDLYSVGIYRIDEEHKQLIGLINAAEEMEAKGGNHTYIKKILGTLSEYTQSHFKHEDEIEI